MQLRHVPHSRIRRIVWELLDKSGNPITQRTDTSVGVMTVPPLSACLHLTFVLLVAIWALAVGWNSPATLNHILGWNSAATLNHVLGWNSPASLNHVPQQHQKTQL